MEAFWRFSACPVEVVNQARLAETQVEGDHRDRYPAPSGKGATYTHAEPGRAYLYDHAQPGRRVRPIIGPSLQRLGSRNSSEAWWKRKHP